MTQPIATPDENNLSQVSVITCDLCSHEFSYDPNNSEIENSASAKCPKCSYNQTTITKPRLKDVVSFAAPVVLVYTVTIVALLLNR